MAKPEIPARLKQLVDRLTESEGEQMAWAGIPMEQIIEFASRWQYDCLRILLEEIDRLTAGAWPVPKIRHDENADVGPNIIGDWIFRAAGQSDVEHTRHYAAQLLAAADELERRQSTTATREA